MNLTKKRKREEKGYSVVDVYTRVHEKIIKLMICNCVIFFVYYYMFFFFSYFLLLEEEPSTNGNSGSDDTNSNSALGRAATATATLGRGSSSGSFLSLGLLEFTSKPFNDELIAERNLTTLLGVDGGGLDRVCSSPGATW